MSSIQDNASLFLNIIPVSKSYATYNEEQVKAALEQEYYSMRDNIEIAISELVNEVATEETIYSLPSEDDAYDSFPLDRAGLNSLPTSASDDITTFAATFASYNSSPTAISFGLPDGFGPRYGLFQWPIMDAVVAAGTGQPIYILSEYISQFINNAIPVVSNPTFDAFFKGISDKVTLGTSQANFLISKVRNIMATVSSTISIFKNWDFDNIPDSVASTVISIVNKMNLNPLKSVGFFTNAFRDTTSLSDLTDLTFVNKMYTEALFGMDKYITSFAVKNIIPSDFSDLRINFAKGIIREMGLANELLSGISFKSLSEIDLQSLVFSNYSLDSHMLNRFAGIINGEEPLPNTRMIIEKISSEYIPILGFNGEYTPRDEERGVGGKPGKSDYNPLAVGETADGTPIEKREARVKTGIITANNQEFDEPKPVYNAKYPNNIVFEKNGMVVEIDTTPGFERFHVYHPSHSYFEIDGEGNSKTRAAKDTYEFTDRDLKRFVRVNSDTVVGGTLTQKSKEMHIKADMIYLNCD